jgi:1-acyl-sn-glycerol-3-phosphate acyltransferase
MFYWIAWAILRIVLLIRCKYRVIGAKNIPKTGGAILLSNHKSYSDAVTVGTAISFRKINYLAKAELFNVPIFHSIIEALGAYPVNRSVLDLKALRKSEKLLKEKKLVLIFGEGTRNKRKDVKLLPIKKGFASLARKLNVPVIPLYIKGTEEILSFNYIRPLVVIRFGKPIYDKNAKDILKKTTDFLLNHS